MKKALEFLQNHIQDNSTLVVAVSAGPDSMCLLDLVLKLRSEKKLNIICAHVNHNKRKQSETEYKYLETYCRENKIIFEGTKIRQLPKDNFHNEARIFRYNFFKDLIEKHQAKYLLTAHHGDDLVETILMRISRGSNLHGYAGFNEIIKKDNYTILKPLIFLTKTEIEEYNQKNKIKYYVDASNDQDDYTRNRYRHQVLKFLKEENPQVHEKYYQFHQKLAEYENYIANIVDIQYQKVVNDNIVDIKKLLKQDKLIQTEILEKYLHAIYSDSLYLISDKHLLEIKKALKSSKPNILLELPNNKMALKEYNNFRIINEEKNSGYVITLSEETPVYNGVIKKVEKTSDNSNFFTRISFKDVKLPLIVRTRENGDYMEIKNLSGKKKVKDIFIDEKIPVSKRDLWPLVVDSNNNIVWLPGLKKSKFAKDKSDLYDIIFKYEINQKGEENEEK